MKRMVLPDCPHHVRERGVRKDPIFHDDSDYMVYIRVLKAGCLEHGVEIWAYCLMTNHVHLVAVPRKDSSISKALHVAHTNYSKYFNAKYSFSGHLWERRPDMCAMEDAHMWSAVRYVERNPVRAGMVKRAEDYLWSSAAAHCGLRDDILLSGTFPPEGVIEDWPSWLLIDHTDEERRIIREHTTKGRVWCTPEMLLQLETMTGRTLTPRKRGRPKKFKENPSLTSDYLFSDSQKNT